MKWVTREHVHLDRVACPWLIRRFIDPKAEFLFVPFGKEDARPGDAIPFAIPNVELAPHDEHITCFERFLQKYELKDPALAEMARVIASGIHHATTRGDERNNVPALEGIGLDALSQGMGMVSENDAENIEVSLAVYDALFAYCKAQVLMRQDASLAQKGLLQRAELLKGPIKAALSRR